MSRKASGFAEEQGKFSPAPALDDPDTARTEGRLTIGPGGRVVVPAEIRAALGVDEGDTLLASVVDGELRLMSTQTAIARAQAIVRAYIPADTPSLADDLIADRRAEAAAEQAWADARPKLGNSIIRTARK